MAAGLWVVLVIPAILAFLFGAWVFYNVVVDVSHRYDGGPRASCVEGCQRPPSDTG
ncbi:MAG: hypothetical protein ACREBU_11190 [Nitrososphaera sp.]